MPMKANINCLPFKRCHKNLIAKMTNPWWIIIRIGLWKSRNIVMAGATI